MNFDLHIHTKYSFDSITNPKYIVNEAIKKNLDGIAITDHNTMKGYFFTRQFVKENLLLIQGEEISTNICEIIGLFLTEEIKESEFMDAIDKIKEQGGIVVIPHPFVSLDEKKLASMLTKIDAIEIFNSRSEKKFNDKCKKFLEKTKFPIVAGSDAHTLKEIGNAYLITKDISDYEELRKTIIKKKNSFKGEYSGKAVKIYSNLLTVYKNKDIKTLKRMIKNSYKILIPSYWR